MDKIDEKDLLNSWFIPIWELLLIRKFGSIALYFDIFILWTCKKLILKKTNVYFPELDKLLILFIHSILTYKNEHWTMRLLHLGNKTSLFLHKLVFFKYWNWFCQLKHSLEKSKTIWIQSRCLLNEFRIWRKTKIELKIWLGKSIKHLVLCHSS